MLLDWLRRRFTPDPRYATTRVWETPADSRTVELLERLRREGECLAADGWREVRTDPLTGRAWMITPHERDVSLVEHELEPLSAERSLQVRRRPGTLRHYNERGVWPGG